MFFRFLVTLPLLAACAFPADLSWEWLNRAYEALRKHNYDQAIGDFRRTLAQTPDRVDVRKDLAYTLLKTGEYEEAREELAVAVRLAPADHHLAREYAYLCFETRHEAEGRRIFKRLAEAGDPEGQRKFLELDSKLRTAISRWQDAATRTPDSYSAHEELATLAEQGEQFALAADHYLQAWKLRRDRRFLLGLGRVRQAMGDSEGAMAALLAASRGGEPRTAETARALLPSRYPWIYEFRGALKLDSDNLPLHRELAFLLLEMKQRAEAEAEFRLVIARNAEDSTAMAQLGFLLLERGEATEALALLDRAKKFGDDDLRDRIHFMLREPKELRTRPDVPRRQTGEEALRLAEKSLEKGYLKDAARYLRVAHENDPLDFRVLLKLGWANNLLHQDETALQWFRMARRSPDPAIAAEAEQAYRNLRPQFARFRTSVWTYPMYSSRWRDLFNWAQYKAEWKPSRRLSPYISVRFAGDVRRTTISPVTQLPAFLSESAVIAGGGFTTRTFHGLRGWLEAGVAFNYLKQGEAARTRPDLRGGVSYNRSLGRNLGGEVGGLFAETNLDLLYISRFDRDTILYGQNRAGYTLARWGPAQFQLVYNFHLTADLRRYAWANTVETGPGVRVRVAAGTPFVFSADALSGHYTVPDGSRPSVYSDLRIGLWYAFSH